MAFSVIIPARYASSRLPAKPLAEIAGKPLICHVVERANASDAERVIVATDDARIAEVLETADCQVVMTAQDHQSGSDRLAEVVQSENFAGQHVVVNVQGDEPMIPARLINEVAAKLLTSSAAVMATAAQKIVEESDFHNPNIVKVVTDKHSRALYFSRAPIPFPRAGGMPDLALHHIGIYAYRCGFLKQYARLEPSATERAESLEQLRVLENGEQILVQVIDYPAGLGVDTQEDLERARKLMQAQAW